MILGTTSIASAAKPAAKVANKGTPTVLVVGPISGAGCASGCATTVTWSHLGYSNHGKIVLVECNYNLLVTEDGETACNTNSGNVNQPGGPWFPSDQAAGSGSASITLESGTVGTDGGACNSGDACVLLVANALTQAPITETEFAVGP